MALHLYSERTVDDQYSRTERLQSAAMGIHAICVLVRWILEIMKCYR